MRGIPWIFSNCDVLFLIRHRMWRPTRAFTICTFGICDDKEHSLMQLLLERTDMREIEYIILFLNQNIIGPWREKTCLRVVANNKNADQPTHPRSLISVFVIRLLESIISRLATIEISIVLLLSVTEETGLSETPKTGYLASRPICYGHPRV